MNQIEKIFSESKDSSAFAKGYLEYLSRVLNNISPQEISKGIQLFEDARQRGATLFFIGNGGSAATASHFVNDISIGTRSWDKPFKALCLSDNVPGLTAIANDYGYDDVFLMPLRVHARPGDLLIAISASGNSKNLLSALSFALENGLTTLALTGFDGGQLKKRAHHSIHVPTAQGEYGPVEDAHMVLDHLISAYFMYQSRRKEVDDKR